MLRRVLFVSVLAVAACGPTRVWFPAGPVESAPEAMEAWTAASEACRGASAFSAEVRVNGRVSDQRLRGATLQGLMTRDGGVLLRAVAPVGPPIFVLTGLTERATLTLPREQRVLVAPAADIVNALIGLPLAPLDLLEVLTGCVARGPATDGAKVGSALFVSLQGGAARARLVRAGSTWQVRAGERPDVLVEYGEYQGRWPSMLRLTSRSDAAVAVNLEMHIGQVFVNTPTNPQAFVPSVDATWQPMTIDELRAMGPLGAGRSGDARDGGR
jgi:hypothetical protein